MALKEAFLTDEPLEKSLGMAWSSDLEKLWISALDHKMSLMVVNEDSGEIMGLRVIRITKKNEHVDPSEFTDEDVLKLLGIFEYSEKFDFFSHYETTEIFEFFGLGVVPKYRRQGLGTILMETGVKFLQNLGIRPSYIKGSASSNFSRRIYEKCKFDPLHEFPIEEYKVDGKVVFDNTGEHKTFAIFGKSL